LVDRIRALEVGGDRCQVDRLHKELLGGTAHQSGEECYECPGELVEACAGVTEGEVTSYLSFVDTLLETVSSEPTVEVSHLALHDRVFSALPGSQRLEGLTVFSIRQSPSQKRGLIARLTSWHGVRVEFYLNRGAELAWRTLLRVPTGTPRGIGKALLEESFPNGGPG